MKSALTPQGNIWVIGDLHGCHAEFEVLLKQLKLGPADRLVLLGDLVARGPDSLDTLRYVKELCRAGVARTVLGNHDLHLLACWRGFSKVKPKDHTQQLLADPDCDRLMHWLRAQPLAIDLSFMTADQSKRAIAVHAGVPPIWSRKDTLRYALEVQRHLGGDMKKLDEFLQNMYSNEPRVWSEGLTGYARLRTITNYLTRMRLISKNSSMEFDFKTRPSAKQPKGFRPWYEWPRRSELKIYFGHWAALEAAVDTTQARALDGGCVWGGELIAEELVSGKVLRVPSNQIT